LTAKDGNHHFKLIGLNLLEPTGTEAEPGQLACTFFNCYSSYKNFFFLDGMDKRKLVEDFSFLQK
jgi:hypothetical protein